VTIESVREWMTVDPVTIHEGTSLGDARTHMQRSDVSRLLVVDTSGHLVGIVTWGDVAEAWPSRFSPLEPFEVRELMARVMVEEVMTVPVVSVDSDTTVAEAASLMFEHKLGALPVVDGGEVVGILTNSDLLQGLVRILSRVEDSAPD